MAIQRGRRLRIAALAVAVALACILGLAAWWYGPWRQKYAVAMPPPTASQRQVVLAYLRALDAHDSATAEALSAPAMRSTTQMWLGSTARITDIRIGTLSYAAQEPNGEQYSVATNFVYRSHWWKNDPSFADGPHYWEYWLAKVDGRWLISDEGTG